MLRRLLVLFLVSLSFHVSAQVRTLSDGLELIQFVRQSFASLGYRYAIVGDLGGGLVHADLSDVKGPALFSAMEGVLEANGLSVWKVGNVYRIGKSEKAPLSEYVPTSFYVSAILSVNNTLSAHVEGEWLKRGSIFKGYTVRDVSPSCVILTRPNTSLLKGCVL